VSRAATMRVGRGADARSGSARPGRETGATRRTWWVAGLAFVAFFVMSASWALSSPISASPDEPAHFVKAASVVRGQLVGDATDSPPVKEVEVPAGVAYSSDAACFAFAPDVTADCAPGYPTADEADDIVEDTTSAGLYNPVYYALVGWPSLVLEGKGALFGMRLASALLCAVFFALGIAALSRLPRPLLPTIAGIAGIVPTLWFLSGSVNPNALETVVALAFAATYFVVLLDESVRRPRGGFVVAMGVSGALLVHIRGLSPLWLGLIVVIGLVLVGFSRWLELIRTPRVIAAVAGIAVSLALALVWAVRTNSLPSVGMFPGQGTTFVGGVAKMLEKTVDFAVGMIGSLGWLDTPSPSYATYAFLVGAAVIVLVPLLVPGPRGPRAALALALALFVLVPPVVQGSTVTESGYVWQGRYNLPLFLVLVVTAAVVVAPSAARLSPIVARRLVVLAVVAAPLGVVASQLTFLKRNAIGLNASWIALFRDPAWHPPGASAALWMLVIVAAGAVLLVCSALVVRLVSAAPRPESPEQGIAPRGRREAVSS